MLRFPSLGYFTELVLMFLVISFGMFACQAFDDVSQSYKSYREEYEFQKFRERIEEDMKKLRRSIDKQSGF